MNAPRREDRSPGPVERLRAWLGGPPIPLPAIVDDVAERWASAGPRVRLVVALAAATGILGAATSSAFSSPWGDPVRTVVAVRELHTGETVSADDVRIERRPDAILPDGAVTDREQVTGRALARTVPAGSVLTASDVADGGPAADLPEGLVAFPLPLTDAAVLSPGQRVDLVAGDGGGAGARLAAAALVLAVEDDSAWVAVQRDEAPALAGAGRWNEVVPVLLPP